MKSGASAPQHHRRPAHQNTFAYRHNPNSRKTKVILALPNTGLCQRCHDVIEWKKKYRKYKPLDRPRKCTGCGAAAIKLAYHVVCRPCSTARGVCAKCLEPHALVETEDAATAELRQQIELLETHKGAIPGVPERERRALLRQLLRGGEDGEDGGGRGGAGGDGEDAAALAGEACGACCATASASAEEGGAAACGVDSGDGEGGGPAASCGCACHAAELCDDEEDDDDEGSSEVEEGDDDEEDDDEDAAPAILREALRRSRARRAAASAAPLAPTSK